MPKNHPIPKCPSDIRRRILNMAARKGGLTRKEALETFKDEFVTYGLPEFVWRVWSEQLRRERVARRSGAGRAAKLVASPSRIGAKPAQVPAP